MTEQQQVTASEDALVLPPMCDAWLDEPALTHLFDDLATCTEILSVQVKALPNAQVGDATTNLQEAAELLRAGAVRGIQIRYRYQSAEWCDTVMKVGTRYRMIRVQHLAGNG